MSSIEHPTAWPRRLAAVAGRLLAVLTLACVPAASAQAQTATPTPTPPSTGSASHEHWMADLNAYIGNTPLSHIAIPGSHDSASYALTGPAWTYAGTQNVDLKTQLTHGVRYVDIRGNYHDGNLFICHGLESSSAPLADVLGDLAAWANVSGHEREIVLASITIGCKDSDPAPPADVSAQVCDTFVSNAGSALYSLGTQDKYLASSGNKQIWERSPNELTSIPGHPRIITNWNACADGQGYSIGAAHFDGYYANVCDQTSVINWIGQALQGRVNAGSSASTGDTHNSLGSPVSGFYTLSVAQTTTANCGVPLYWMGDNSPALRAVQGWYMGNSNNARANLNILYSDFVQTNPVVEDAVQFNQVPPLAAASAYTPLKVNLKTVDGHFLSAVNRGGLNSSGIVHTDASTAGAWETFWIQWLDEAHTKLALKTESGNYMSAVNSGGMGKPWGWINDVPLHTDATSAGDWEALTLNVNPSSGSGNFQAGTLQTPDGHYVSPVNGGGIGENGRTTEPIHTDAQTVGPWEQFSVVKR